MRKTPKFLRKNSEILTNFPILASINNDISSHNLQLIHITSHIHKTQPSINLQQFSHSTNFYSYLCIQKFPHGRSHNTTNPIHRHVDSDKKSEKEEKNKKSLFNSPYFQQHQQRDDSTSSRMFADAEWLLSCYCHLIDCCFCYWQHSNCIRAELTGMS